MNRNNLLAGRHLDHEHVPRIVSGPLPLEKELVYFKHWKECPECRQKLMQEMPTAGFNLSAFSPRTVQVCSVESAISFHFASVESGVLAASFTMRNLREIISRDLNVKVDLGLSEFHINLSAQIDTYFRTGAPFSKPRINTALIGTAFMIQVLFWTWLIPFGQIVTYGDIARWMDKPGASRAVGRALHNNPIPVFIPCHRVIGKDGNLTGFSAGLSLKKQLLCLEGHSIE
ncbi:MAG: methylated-DNA--[protein]-cysteine S-methyltransferase [Candidatus Marinimicrobia bacterium]|nr:methylated-DNA--[protein]-cysteine S-methyltransferase [Candidatus Neomarinimicrobiota bacterium]